MNQYFLRKVAAVMVVRVETGTSSKVAVEASAAMPVEAIIVSLS